MISQTMNFAPHRSDATEENQLAEKFSQKYWQAMPVLNFSSALQIVVETCWEVMEAEAVLLVTPAPGENYLWASYYDQTRSLEETESLLAVTPDWTDWFLTRLEEEWENLFPKSFLTDLHFIPLKTGNSLRGMLVCTFRKAKPLPAFAEAMKITSRFLDQIRLVHHQITLSQLQELKLDSLAEFAAGAGHEINNPLATISGRAQLLLREEQDPERREMLANIGAQALRIRDMIGDLMLFGRPPVPEVKPVSIQQILEQVEPRLNSRFSQEFSIRIKTQHDVELLGDENQLEQVFYALLENGIQNTPPGTTPELEIEWNSGFEDQVQIRIISRHTKLSECDELHLFDPFYSGRQAGRGLGFGLSKVRQIARMHEATLSIKCQAEQG
ncbi:MAG: HAMP domain-containing sensor histidine kinase [Planctomycetaceae bacterium]